MTEIDNGTVDLPNNNQVTLFEASALQIPAIIGGHIDANALDDADDIIDIQLQVKYTSGGAFFNAGTVSFKKSDQICWFTPLESSFGYKILITLRVGSPTGNAALAFVIQSTVVT